jgi:diguanylate cyclase (GGDEF)-like protein
MQVGARKKQAGEGSKALNLRPILDIVKNINTERNLRKLVTMILDTMIEYCNAERGTFAFFKGDSFNAELSRDNARTEVRHSPILGNVLRRVSDLGKAILIDDVRRDSQLQAVSDAPLSVLCLPLCVKSRIIGAVYLDNSSETGAFGSRHREFAEILTDHAAIAIENALLQRQSTQDRITNLYNHAHFEQVLDSEVERARRQGHPVALLMIDVDGFKQINDLYGHETGNDVLRNVAYSLSTTVRGADIIARIHGRPQQPVVGRYGGDEFEIILPGATREGALATATRLVKLINSQRFTCGDQRLKLSVSVGVAVFPDDAQDTYKLLLSADEALYQSKRAGKNRALLYKPREKMATTRKIRVEPSSP